jgi:tetratricopeptide (TPR) repeat protein
MAWSGSPRFWRLERMRCVLWCNLGIALTWHGDLAEARQAHEQALASAEQQGSPQARGRVLGELAVTAMRDGDVEAVRELAPQAQTAAEAGGVSHWIATATALQAWVAWRDKRGEEASELGARALELWDSNPYSYPYCLALWPLIGAHLDAGQVREAAGAAQRLLEPAMARLPDELEVAVQEACNAWDNADPEAASRLLADASKLARELGYA